jgi:hypothetical protein
MNMEVYWTYLGSRIESIKIKHKQIHKKSCNGQIFEDIRSKNQNKDMEVAKNALSHITQVFSILPSFSTDDKPG